MFRGSRGRRRPVVAWRSPNGFSKRKGRRAMSLNALAGASRQTLLQRLAEARRRTDELFGLVRPEALYDRPIPERHRIVFYIGHLEAFDWNLIARGALGRSAFREPFDKLFAFGIDPVGGGLPDEPPSAWPALE